MKAIIKNVFILVLMLFSFSSFADKISIKGEPVALFKNGDIYSVPDTYNTSTEYNFVTLENSRKVCFQKPQPDLNALNVEVINVQIRGYVSRWVCYNYDETYFTVTP